MYKIITKEMLAPTLHLMEVEAPLVARSAMPGQFIILRLHEEGERIPLTIADFDRTRGTITCVFQEVGKTTRELGTFKQGEAIRDFVGPLGAPTHIENYGCVVCVGGGIGVAPIYPIARAMKEAGNEVISIVGSRTKDLLILEEEMRQASQQLIITTDDGTYGRKGFVTQVLQELIDKGQDIAEVIAIGPVVMMRAVGETTRPYGIPTLVSLNPVMVDGTGMCGGCRVSVGDQTKFACVDGPEFDAHQVDFAGLLSRQRMYKEQEKQAEKHTHCAGGVCTCQH